MNADLQSESVAKLSTPALESLLREKYSRDKYALIFDVPDAVSLDQRRRIDAVAFGCWRSLGRTLEGFELKVSRSDWLREVKQVDKADPFVALCDYFWLVTADTSVAKLEEIPACWGWMAATKTGLRIQKPAAKLPGCGEAFPRSFVIGVMRRLQDDLLANPDVAAHIASRLKQAQEGQQREIEYATRRATNSLDENRKAIQDFEAASGLKFTPWQMGNVGHIVGQLRKLGWGAEGGLATVTRLLDGHANALRTTLQRIDEVRAGLESTESAQKP